jgi:hypothetical protein
VDIVHGLWTNGAPRSTVDRSGVGAGAAMVHGRSVAHHAWELAGGVGEGEQVMARPRDGSPMQDQWRRGNAMGLEIMTAAALRRRRHKCLGREENEGGSVDNNGERRGPFYRGRGRACRVRKGETAGGGGGIKGAQLNTVIHDYGPGKGV